MTRSEGSSSQPVPQTSESTTAPAEGSSSSAVRPEAFAADRPVPDSMPSLRVHAQESVPVEPQVQDIPPANNGAPSTSELRERRVQRLDRQEDRDPLP